MLRVKKILLTLVICLTTGNLAWASDNVLQAIQVNGVNDSYNIILKSDDVAELKKTIQAPNKMIINLKGIRASKTINTIYNGTSSIDSVVVEPINDDTVKILVQGDNVSTAQIHFDSLKTPLGVLGNTANQTKPTDEIVLSDPMTSYRPVYQDDSAEEDGFSFGGTGITTQLKNALKSEKVNWLVTFGLFILFLLSGMKMVKGKDNEIKIGLSQSLKEREIELYRNAQMPLSNINQASEAQSVYPNAVSNVSLHNQNMPAANYGLKAYQQSTRNPYVTSEIQKPRPAVQQPSAPAANLQQAVKTAAALRQQPVSPVVQKPAMTASAPKASNIDSMKFLESMTKIYEKNGRSDLAQGLKANLKKAKMNLV